MTQPIPGDRRAQPEGIKLPSWAVPIVIAVLTSAAIAYTQLSGTESAAAHAADLSEVRTEIATVRSDAKLDAVRDSARYDAMMRVLLDIQRRTPR